MSGISINIAKLNYISVDASYDTHTRSHSRQIMQIYNMIKLV